MLLVLTVRFIWTSALYLVGSEVATLPFGEPAAFLMLNYFNYVSNKLCLIKLQAWLDQVVV
jgi:hypothetical protein